MGFLFHHFFAEIHGLIPPIEPFLSIIAKNIEKEKDNW